MPISFVFLRPQNPNGNAAPSKLKTQNPKLETLLSHLSIFHPLHNDPQPWQVLNRRYTLDRSPYMVLREDTVQLANGAVIPDYFVFEYPDWVSVLAVTKQGELVLIRQYRHGIAKVYYELVAGVADEGASLLENAQRELEAEQEKAAAYLKEKSANTAVALAETILRQCLDVDKQAKINNALIEEI